MEWLSAEVKYQGEFSVTLLFANRRSGLLLLLLIASGFVALWKMHDVFYNEYASCGLCSTITITET